MAVCKRPFHRIPSKVPSEKTIALAEGVRDRAVPFGCGKCLPCRIHRSWEWRSRLLMEAEVSKKSYFVSLTYSWIPREGVSRKEYTNYCKRLRNRIGKFRHFGIGEYGEKNYRPHYHQVVFTNEDLDLSQMTNGVKLAWNKGFQETSELTERRAGYITGYITDKIGKEDDERRREYNPVFQASSRQNGGIGWSYLKNMTSKYPITHVRIKGKKCPVGRYLSKKYADERGIDPALAAAEYHRSTNELFARHHDAQCFADSVYKESEQRIKGIERRHQIYRRRKGLT